MNENEMLYWIENIWTKRERISNPQSLLVLDSFSAHIVGEKNTNIAVIPGGLTSRLQPLDVSVNKSFKTKVIIITLIPLILSFNSILLFDF